MVLVLRANSSRRESGTQGGSESGRRQRKCARRCAEPAHVPRSRNHLPETVGEDERNVRESQGRYQAGRCIRRARTVGSRACSSGSKSVFAMATLPVIAYRFGHWTLGVRIPVVGQLLRDRGLFFRKFVEAIYQRPHRCSCRDWPGVCDPLGLRDQPGQDEDRTEFHHCDWLPDFTCLPRYRRRRLLRTGAKLVGDAKIGNNVMIAANSLVLTDVTRQH